MKMTSLETTRTRWRELHEEFGDALRRAIRVAEGQDRGESRHVEERLVQCIWFDQLLRADKLRTASGKRVEVLDAGRWNTSRGPDFQGARVRLAGEELAGDVEIHVNSADWFHHGHHQDFEYNNVVLHVCLNPADDRPYEEKQNGERLERMVLLDALDPDLETLRRTINVDDYPYGRPADVGICHDHFTRIPEPQLTEFLTIAGRMRIEDKIARFEAQLASATTQQLIYQSIMTGQGYKSNKTLYFLLSKRAPFTELMDHAHDIAPPERPDLFLAILLHVAQLFPTQQDLFDGADKETIAFAERLEKHWNRVRPYFRDRLLPPTRRWYSGMRPPGFPGRRLAAVAILLTRLVDVDAPLFDVFCSMIRNGAPENEKPKDWRKFYRDVTKMLEVDGDQNYFGTHYTLGGKPCRPQALLGEPAARTLFFNVLLPLAILRARQEGDTRLEQQAWVVAARFPALPKNSVTEFMKRRLFGESGFDKGLFRTELMQQALFKVFHDCCAQNERACANCTFLNAPYEPLMAMA
ncbi:DUF2851 family protein [bacterium]|nr:DUF2851 family protein [bacterium]